MDKNKIIEAAGKLVAKGAYDKAIKEYQKILEVDPRDVRILQKMGELYQKKNDNGQAATFIMKVAESYAKDGFFLKAVAQYKQVLKLDPGLVDINIQLAELHQQLQLMGEAMAYYQIVANHYDKQGDVRKSLDVLRKMVDLDPDNVQSRVKLADLYIRERMSDEATTELSRAAEHLKRQNRIDDYLRVAEKISALKPDDLQLARELAEIYLQRSDQKRALAKLQVCFKADPRDIETLKLLGVAFQGLGQTSKTLSVYKELARAYEERGQHDDAERTWQQVGQLDPNDADLATRAAGGVPGPVTIPMPTGRTGMAQAYVPAQQATMAVPVHQPRSSTSQVTAMQPAPSTTALHAAATTAAATAAAAVKPKAESLGKLLTETDVYVKYGLHDKALEHLRKVFSVEPENIDAHEKAYAIYVASNNHAQAGEQLLNVLRLHTRIGDRARAQPYLTTILQQNPGHPEVSVFLEALRADAEPAPVEAQPAAADDAILVDSSDDEVIVADEPIDEPISAEVAISGEEIEPELIDEELPSSDDMAMAAAAEDQPVADEYVESASVIESDDEPATGAMLLDEEPRTGEYETAGPALGDESSDVPTSGRGYAFVPMPDDSAGYPTESAFPVEPTPTLSMEAVDQSLVKTAAGYRSDTVAALQATSFALEDVPPAEAFEEAVEEVVEEAVEAPPEEEPASEECDEATFFIEQGLFDEAREILETVLIAYPEHQRAAALLAQVEAGQGGAVPPPPAPNAEANGEARDAFDLAQELADELGDFGQEAAAAPAASGGDDYQVSVEEVFAEFKKGLEKVVKPEDVDTHYDLGIAYKEMGLIDDAVSEFTIARKGCIGKKKEVDCLTMCGLLQVMKGDFPMAVDAFMQALTSEHSTGEVEKATRFELAVAYEGAGRPGRALAEYLKVHAVDPAYREVAAHVERLSAVAVPEDEPPPDPPASAGGRKGGPSRKVGYV